MIAISPVPKRFCGAAEISGIRQEPITRINHQLFPDGILVQIVNSPMPIDPIPPEWLEVDS